MSTLPSPARVLLVNPHMEGHESFVVLPHLGLGYLSAALKPRGHTVGLWDGPHQLGTLSDLEHHVEATGPWDVIGISVFTTYFETARAYCRMVRRRWPDALLVAGGPHPSFEPEETLQRIPELDFVVRAEGEEAFPQLLDELASPTPDLALVPNLAWRDGEQIHLNDIRYLESLDTFPQPDWELLEPDSFPLKPNGIFTRERRIAPMVVTRGCPYECTFCGAPKMTGRALRRRSADNVVDELELLNRRYGIREFHFMDDNFTLHQPYLKELCQRIIDRGLDISWACPNGVRLDSLRPDSLRLMEASGCYSFAVGIEVGSQRTLDSIKKEVTIARIREQLQMIRDTTSKIRVTGFFILGLPQETQRDVLDTIRFSLSLPIDRANFFNYSPFPGTELFEDLRETGRLAMLDYSRVYIHSLSFEHPHIPRWKLRSLVQLAHLSFYLRPRILRGVAGEIQTWSQVEVILGRLLTIARGRI